MTMVLNLFLIPIQSCIVCLYNKKQLVTFFGHQYSIFFGVVGFRFIILTNLYSLCRWYSSDKTKLLKTICMKIMMTVMARFPFSTTTLKKLGTITEQVNYCSIILWFFSLIKKAFVLNLVDKNQNRGKQEKKLKKLIRNLFY